MLWTIKTLECAGNGLAEIKLMVGRYNKPGYAMCYIVIPLSDASKYPLGSQFSMTDLMAVLSLQDKSEAR